MLGDLLLSFANIATRNAIRDDDAVDQLNHWATAGFLSAMAIATGAKQFVGHPISCWLPATHRDSWYQSYTDNYCWISNMYYFPFSEAIPAAEEDRWEVEISFYRWVMVMFLLQALMFKLPNLLWTELKGYCGLNVEKVVGMIHGTVMMVPKEREEQLSHTAVFIHRWLESYILYRRNASDQVRQRVSCVLFCFGKRIGNYLTGLYMFTKILYVINVFGQFFLMSSFLGVNFWRYGFEAMSIFFKEGQWEDHYTFPRVGLCDYQIRQKTNVQTYSAQCVLPINLFLEKMYLVLWFWMVGIFIATVINLGLWLVDYALPNRNETFMFRYARMLGIKEEQDKRVFRAFACRYLRRDGVFILRMVANNTSSMLCFQLVKELWKVFLEDLKNKDRNNGTLGSSVALNGENHDSDIGHADGAARANTAHSP